MDKELPSRISKLQREREIAKQFYLWAKCYNNYSDVSVDEMFTKFKKLKAYKDIPQATSDEILTEKHIVLQICSSFGLKDTDWIKSKSKPTQYAIARQLLMTMLIEHMNYSLANAGKFCNRDHSTAVHARKMIYDTYFNDAIWGNRVRQVIFYCQKVSNLKFNENH